MDDDAPLDDVWTQARALFAEALQRCDDPHVLAETIALERKDHAQRADFVLFVERLVRRLIVISAAEMARDLPPAKPAISEPAKPKPRSEPTKPAAKRTRPVFDPHAPPDTWSVTFSVLPQQNEPGPRYVIRRDHHRANWLAARAKLEAAGVRKPYIPPYQPAPLVRSACLARRMEALRRVIDNPHPWVRRTALRMQRIRAYNVRANAPRLIRAAPYAARHGYSSGHARCGPAINALERRCNHALAYLESG